MRSSLWYKTFTRDFIHDFKTKVEKMPITAEVFLNKIRDIRGYPSLYNPRAEKEKILIRAFRELGFDIKNGTKHRKAVRNGLTVIIPNRCARDGANIRLFPILRCINDYESMKTH